MKFESTLGGSNEKLDTGLSSINRRPGLDKPGDLKRVWAMPSASTFGIKPIADLLAHYIRPGHNVLDPFARNSNWGTCTNDLNPLTTAEFHLDALVFLRMVEARGLQFHGMLFDAPFSARQIKECYQGVGRQMTQEDGQLGKFYKACKDVMDRLLQVGGYAICFGWNTSGFGVGRGYVRLDGLAVNHGGAHNDTLVTVERKLAKLPDFG